MQPSDFNNFRSEIRSVKEEIKGDMKAYNGVLKNDLSEMEKRVREDIKLSYSHAQNAHDKINKVDRNVQRIVGGLILLNIIFVAIIGFIPFTKN